MAELREKRVDLILQQLDDLPTLPTIAVRLLQATADDLTTAKQVVSLISSDPALTARILQLVHRADSGVRVEITSIERAVVLLGFDAVRCAVLALSVFQNFSPQAEGPVATQFKREEFWKHCLAVACCAEMLAEPLRTSGVSPSEAFVCGLLHDLGKVALDAALPKSFGRVVEAADLLRGNIADVERSVIGLDHMVVGKRMAEKWKLPASIRDCIWLHGQDPAALPSTVRNPRLVNLITLADQIVRQQHLGYSGNYSANLPMQSLLDATGLTPHVVESASKRLVEKMSPRAEALGLGRTNSTEIFQSALAQANRELGRVSGQLAAKNRKLSVRAQFFEALSRFQSELQPDSSPQAVLQAIAQTANDLLGTTAVAIFSLPSGQNYAETLVCDGEGAVIENALLDVPAETKEPGAEMGDTNGNLRLWSIGDGPIANAGPELDWFVAMVSPRLAGSSRFRICLSFDGHCIGGVVWGAEAGEIQRLAPKVQELCALSNGWTLALRSAQIREESRDLAEQLAEANRRLKDVESEILRGRMLITVGEMAAGAAHEMNNPLAVISGRSQLLAQQLSDPKFKAAAQLIFEQSHRLSAIITDLMEFAQPQAPVIRPVEIAEAIDLAIKQAKARNNPADRRIEVTASDVPPVEADLEQLSAAMTEVIENAMQATDPASGEIMIHAGFDAISSRVAVTVADNGAGMDEHTLAHAFDPFFSAKAAGRRRGLGLAKAQRWIEGSGGSIRLESRPEHGARAVILLPAATIAANRKTPAPAPEARAS